MIVRLISRTADPVADHHDAIAQIDGSEHGRENANVSFRPRYDERIDTLIFERLVEACA